jgi:molecular chaperone GrpE (heat shock protein)
LFTWLKKKPDISRQLMEECNTKVDTLAETLHATLTRMDETLRKTSTQVRRSGVAMEMHRESQEHKLDALQKMLAPQWAQSHQHLMAFAEAFALYLGRQQDEDESLRQVVNKFTVFLESQGVELIWDLHAPFNDALHQVCATREEAGRPEGMILEVVRPGFLVQGQVAAPALVIVNKYGQTGSSTGEGCTLAAFQEN